VYRKEPKNFLTIEPSEYRNFLLSICTPQDA